MGFLLLTRETEQSIQIGADVLLTVGRIGNGKVRLIVNAPKSMRIRRSEILPQPAAAAFDDAETRTHLVIRRRELEAIVIGDLVTVTVERIGVVRVLLSVEAPEELIVLRTEIIDRPPSEIQPQQKASA